MIGRLDVAALVATAAVSVTALSINSSPARIDSPKVRRDDPQVGWLEACDRDCFNGNCGNFTAPDGQCMQFVDSSQSFNATISSWKPQPGWLCQMWTSDDCGLGTRGPSGPQGNMELGVYPGDGRVTAGLNDLFQSYLCNYVGESLRSDYYSMPCWDPTSVASVGTAATTALSPTSDTDLLPAAVPSDSSSPTPPTITTTIIPPLPPRLEEIADVKGGILTP
ncbi:hypothetical protein C8R47DRAFT_1327866 [Mycena vitilis]|nr:hypothetical protein C8R47DRAFT_1327866 [Mycena vitilis]